jgi:hypothetical protein
MTREQMFGTHYCATLSNVPGTTTLFFDTKPRLTPEGDCGPDDHACRLHDQEKKGPRFKSKLGRFEYDLCPRHTRWWRSAR